MLRRSLIALAAVIPVVSACAKDNDAPAAAPAPTYVAPAPTVAQPAVAQPAVAPATPAPVGTVPAAAGGVMATPGPLALPCTGDASCGFARCNVQFQKCAFPCASAVDCAAGASCNTLTGLCLPGAAPQ
jgi:hypothetical protein